MTALAIQIGLSILAIALVTLVVARLGLGGDTRIRDEDTARRLADEAIYGFAPSDIAIDRAGFGALLRDADWRVMLLRRNGAHFAARLLDRSTLARLDRNFLIISTPDRWFGAVTLDLGPQAQVWASSFRRLGS